MVFPSGQDIQPCTDPQANPLSHCPPYTEQDPRVTLTLQLVLCSSPLQQGQVADDVLQVDHLGHGGGRRRGGGFQGAGAFP